MAHRTKLILSGNSLATSGIRTRIKANSSRKRLHRHNTLFLILAREKTQISGSCNIILGYFSPL